MGEIEGKPQKPTVRTTTTSLSFEEGSHKSTQGS